MGFVRLVGVLFAGEQKVNPIAGGGYVIRQCLGQANGALFKRTNSGRLRGA